jgi:hypothetical protein
MTLAEEAEDDILVESRHMPKRYPPTPERLRRRQQSSLRHAARFFELLHTNCPRF